MRTRLRTALIAAVALLLLNACAVVRSPERVRIALFAPFEGRYREVGYNALYAARLALSDATDGDPLVDLLPVDDGGTQALDHARALAQDPLVMAVIALGYDGTTRETLHAFDDIPVLVAGDWGALPMINRVFILSNPEINQQLTVSPRIGIADAAALPAPIVGGEVFALEGFRELRESLDGVTVLSSGALPDAEFTARYQASDPFAPMPDLLATLTYDASGIAIRAAQTGSRGAALEHIRSMQVEGINGTIRFENQYWADAPFHRYEYVDGVLVASE